MQRSKQKYKRYSVEQLPHGGIELPLKEDEPGWRYRSRIAYGFGMRRPKKDSGSKEEIMYDGNVIHNFFQRVWHKHKEHAVGDAKNKLGKSDILALTVLSIFSAFLITFVDFIIYLRWASFENNAPFSTYHPMVPWLIIAFNLILIYCFWLKGIKFWLVYYPPILGIIYYLLEAALINSWITPYDLANFFAMFGLRHLPNWLVGI